MKSKFLFILLIAIGLPSMSQVPIIIDHQTTHLYQIPGYWIDKARSDLHIAYGHTSHGSQLISGMTGLYDKFGSDFDFNNGGSEGALDMHDAFAYADLGNPDFESWASYTRDYLDDESNLDVNVIIWAWCGELDWAAEENVNTYLTLMDQLEVDYPEVTFVYMTGHLNGSGEDGNLHIRNEQIRSYCETHNKVLYDFADIESFDPEGTVNFMKLLADDYCDYDSNEDGELDANWAVEYSNAHPDSCFYFGECAHSQALNCQQKGIAAWYLWARLAGWEGFQENIPVTNISVTGEGGASTINTPGGTLQLTATVEPANATDKTVTWSMQNNTGQATIGETGLVTAIANGTVTAVANANDGSGMEGSMLLNIENQTIQTQVGYFEAGFSKCMYYAGAIRIEMNEEALSLQLDVFNTSGVKLYNKIINGSENIQMSFLAPGIYVIQLKDLAGRTNTFKIAVP